MNPYFQPYKYNGQGSCQRGQTSSFSMPSAAEAQPKVKELDKMHGLNTYDYGARQHDPILSRWDRIDPLCEKYYGVSPYVYCGNNPVKFIDPDGREWGLRQNGDKTVIYANIAFSNNANLSAEEIKEYQNSIKNTFAELISEVSEGKAIGEINFDVPQKKDQLELNMSVCKDTGFTNSYGDIFVSTQMNNGNKLSKLDFAYSAIHELLHTLTLPDIVDNTEGSHSISDTELIHSGKGYVFSSTKNSAPNLSQNVMSNYVNIIDGNKLDVTQK